MHIPTVSAPPLDSVALKRQQEIQKLKHLTLLKQNIHLLLQQQDKNKKLTTLTNIGNEFFIRSQVEDTSKIHIQLKEEEGFKEFSLNEAITEIERTILELSRSIECSKSHIFGGSGSIVPNSSEDHSLDSSPTA